MTESYVGEIRAFGHDKIPRGWIAAEGQTLSIPQYQALFSLLGTQFGGNGTTTFALPDLRGRVPVCIGRTDKDAPVRHMGESGGSETVALTLETMPSHMHVFNACSAVGTTPDATDGHLGAVAKDNTPKTSERWLYGPGAGNDLTALHAASVSQTGGSAPHNNMQPFAVLAYAICITGIFPPRD